nr:hypothetical protein [bacterium]
MSAGSWSPIQPLIPAAVTLTTNPDSSIASPLRVILPLPITTSEDPAEASIFSDNFSLATSIFPPWNVYCFNVIQLVNLALTQDFSS